MSKRELVKTARRVIKVLGGVNRFVELTDAKPKAVYHWRSINGFPCNTYCRIVEELKARGYTAPIKLWPGMLVPDKRKRKR